MMNTLMWSNKNQRFCFGILMSLPTHLLMLSVGRLWEPQSTSHLLNVVGYFCWKQQILVSHNLLENQRNFPFGLNILFLNHTFITLKKHSLFFPELKVNRRPNIGDPDSTLVCYNILKSPFYWCHENISGAHRKQEQQELWCCFHVCIEMCDLSTVIRLLAC